MMYMLISVVWVTCTKKFGAMQQKLQRVVLGGASTAIRCSLCIDFLFRLTDLSGGMNLVIR